MYKLKYNFFSVVFRCKNGASDILQEDVCTKTVQHNEPVNYETGINEHIEFLVIHSNHPAMKHMVSVY